MVTKNTDGVVIIGGGVLGFSIAYHLAREGILSYVINPENISPGRKAEFLLVESDKGLKAIKMTVVY